MAGETKPAEMLGCIPSLIGLILLLVEGVAWLRTGHAANISLAWFLPPAQTGWVGADQILNWFRETWLCVLLIVGGSLWLWWADLATD